MTVIAVFLIPLILIGLLVYVSRKPQSSGSTITIAEAQTATNFSDTVLTVPAPPPIPIIEPAPAPQNTEEMANFDIAYAIVRRHEGGYQKMPEDRGNYNSRRELVGTNWGINAQVYENYLRRPPTERDMRDMPRHIAIGIYKQIYWDRIRGDEIRDQQVANILFDGHVNHGSWGVKMMQGILGVPRDGIVGPVTLSYINRANPFQLFQDYKAKRKWAYNDLVRRNPTDRRFLRGWLARIDSFFYLGRGGTGASPSTPSSIPPEGGGSGVMTIGLLALATAVYFLR